MFIVESYGLAVALCWVTMLCWGSWGNTQKLAAKTWRYELFYWDYVIGIVLFSLIWGLTLGSTGEAGRGFIQDLLPNFYFSVCWLQMKSRFCVGKIRGLSKSLRFSFR